MTDVDSLHDQNDSQDNAEHKLEHFARQEYLSQLIFKADHGEESEYGK